MNNKKVTYMIAILIILIFSSVSMAAIPVDVTVGKETILTLKKSSKRASIASPEIAEMKLISPSEIVLNGKKAGTTSLIVWDKEGQPTFFDVKVFGDMTVLIKQIKDLAPDADIKVETAGDSIVLTGDLKNEQTKQKIEEIAKAYAPKVINHISIKEAQQVLLEVKVAQIDKGALKKLGISALIKGTSAEGFSNLAGAPTGASTTVITTTGTITTTSGTGISGNVPGLGYYDPLGSFQLGVSYFPSGVGAVLQLLSSKNMAKILAEPNLLVRSGQKGQFLAGSKIPIPIVTSAAGVSTVTIEYKDVGVKLNFEPVVTETGMISLKIDPAEISNITGMIKVAGLESPMIDSREVRTAVELKEGESLILAGLLQEEMVKSMQKIPLLGDIPILGALFRSTSDELKEKELAFFITPRLVKPIAPGVKTELPGDNRPTPDEEREFQWIPLPKERAPEGKGTPEAKPESKSE